MMKKIDEDPRKEVKNLQVPLPLQRTNEAKTADEDQQGSCYSGSGLWGLGLWWLVLGSGLGGVVGAKFSVT